VSPSAARHRSNRSGHGQWPASQLWKQKGLLELRYLRGERQPRGAEVTMLGVGAASRVSSLPSGQKGFILAYASVLRLPAPRFSARDDPCAGAGRFADGLSYEVVLAPIGQRVRRWHFITGPCPCCMQQRG
jgi:hypothetical protein